LQNVEVMQPATDLLLRARGAFGRWWARARNPADFGTLRRAKPLSDCWGYDRGTPIDRDLIDRFLEARAGDVRGRVLEIRDDRYAKRFGRDLGPVDVLDIDASNPRATLIADLCTCDAIRDETYDCAVITQTLQYVDDVPAALAHLRRVLKVGGVLLATAPCVAGIDPGARDADRWRFTPGGWRALAEASFPDDSIEVVPLGNLVVAVGALMGLAREDLTRRELLVDDPDRPVLVGLRVRRLT
jgi:SAM-dependent methyltransferase